MVAVSFLLHISLFGIFYRFGHLVSSHPVASQTYYVDMVNLPVANPRAGNPSTSGKSSPATPAPVQNAMSLPPAPATKTAVPQTAPAPAKQQKTEKSPPSNSEFAERMAKLERKVEGKRIGDAMEALRRRVDSGGRVGMPGAKGIETGSDYASYIQSRLKDAFNDSVAYQSRNPEVVVKLRINRFGKVIGYKIEQSTRDKLFESSVARAISIAGENFPPPPAGEDFEHGFIFRREGVGQK